MEPGRDRGIVTPEAVRLEFAEANVGSRALALLVDSAIQFAGLFALLLGGVLLTATAAVTLVPAWLPLTLVVVLVFLVVFGYPIAFETLWRGRTPGKATLGLRVVTVEGAPVGFRHAAIRAVLGLVDFYATGGAAAVLSVLVTARSQRLGDLVAGTVVLHERSGAPPPRATRFAVPPHLEGYARTLDVAAIDDREYEIVRAFLLRAPGLAPDVRARLAARIAASLSAELHHGIPPQVGPETFLACVAARYQQRTRETGPHAASVPGTTTTPARMEPPAIAPEEGAPEEGAPEEGAPRGFAPPS